MTRSWELENESRRSTKHARQTGKEERGSPTEEPVLVVKPRDDQCPDERVTGIDGKGAPNRSKLPDVVECDAGKFCDVIRKAQGRVEYDPEVTDR